MNVSIYITRIILVCVFISNVNAIFENYINNIGEYFGYKKQPDVDFEEDYTHRIPYEVSTTDEHFLSQAAQLTGVALSELDSCQQRVVLKLQTDCHKMNDEQLAKMAVQLLNCQSWVEGRKIFPCNEDMSIRDCTTNMDSDIWTSYHLMTNRARAVCLSIRQTHFRGLAEHTVNRLMDAARDQLKTLDTIADGQEKLQDITENAFDSLTKGHNILTKQQEDLQKAQFHGQMTIEDNINKLVEEKRLILETHNQILQMTEAVQEKLETSAKQVENQASESQLNHKELIEDIISIQHKAHDIFQKIDESAHLLIKQNEDFKHQYVSTLKNLAEVNKTVHDLVNLVGGTRQALEERLSWITTALGGTDLAVERLYLILWHSAFMLTAMLSSAFLAARASTRLVVATLPPLNLAVALYGEQPYLDPIYLGVAIGVFVLAQTIILYVSNFIAKNHQPLLKIKEAISTTNLETNESPAKPTVSSTDNMDSSVTEQTHYEYKSSHSKAYISNESDDELTSLTPPISRNGFYTPRSRSRSSTPLILNGSLRGICHAKTRLGTPCKLSSLPGRDFCHRHQMGDSVMG